MNNNTFSKRWGYLALGTAVMLFAGVIYAWSILKAPLGEAFGWTATALSFNYTLTMWCFCLGGFAGGLLIRTLGIRTCLFGSAILSGLGFLLASGMSGNSILALYLFYGVMAGLGIGAAFNVIISTVNGWFPDKRGLCSGVLMMGFGTSALVIGKIASALIDGPGWRTAYAAIGISLAIMLTIAALMLKSNEAPARRREESKDSSVQDYTTKEMLRRNSFWFGFFFVVCLGAVGGTVLSFARDLALSIGAEPAAATTLVGVLSVSNGFGRILYGTLFDRAGRKATMIFASVMAIAAALVLLAGVSTVSLPLLTAGICLAGTSYGSCPTISSAFISSFYGTKYFPLNFSVMNFSLIPSSAIATVAGKMVESTDGFTAPIILLVGFAVISLVLNFCIRRP